MHAQMQWQNGMHFTCTNGAVETAIDASKDHGGEGLGPTPKELVLNAMMGCAAMDVVSILKKMRQDIKTFHMQVDAVPTTEHPIHFRSAVVAFLFTGAIDSEKVMKAVDSSLTKYCGVNYMISKSCSITYKVFLNGTEIANKPVEFIEPKN